MRADIKWLDDPEVFRVNQLPAHSDHRYYRSLQEMKEKKSSLAQSLNGLWKFHYSENAQERPEGFFKNGFDDGEFGRIEVPCHIELAGFDKIHYINTMYPWEGHFFRRPAYSLGGKAKWKGMFRTGHVPLAEWQFCGICRGQLYPFGIRPDPLYQGKRKPAGGGSA